MTEITLWANEIQDDKLHHIGEYYEERYKKPWRRKVDGTLTQGFINWSNWQNHNQIFELLSRDFEITRDSNPAGFFIRRKSKQGGLTAEKVWEAMDSLATKGDCEDHEEQSGEQI